MQKAQKEELYLSTLNILHPKSRTDRYELLMKQLEEQGIVNYKLWDNPIGQSMQERRGYVNSGHRKIVAFAKENALPYITIAENDITFFDKGAWNYYWDNLPESYDLYLGMVYVGTVENARLISDASGFTLYTIHSRFYDFFLSISPDKHIDRAITSFHSSFEFKLPPMFVCEQNNTQSDNHMGKPDLKARLVGRKLYSSGVVG